MDHPRQEPEPPDNPCICIGWSLRTSSIFAAIFSMFFHSGIAVVAFALYFFYDDKSGSHQAMVFHVACLVVGILSLTLIPCALLLFVGSVKSNRKLCIIWVAIIIPSTIFDSAAGSIIEQTVGIVLFELWFLIQRVYLVWIVYCFIVELGQKQASRRATELRQNMERTFSQSHLQDVGPSGEPGMPSTPDYGSNVSQESILF